MLLRQTLLSFIHFLPSPKLHVVSHTRDKLRRLSMRLTDLNTLFRVFALSIHITLPVQLLVVFLLYCSSDILLAMFFFLFFFFSTFLWGTFTEH